jgi:cupin fold WbuC family metalloprotein
MELRLTRINDEVFVVKDQIIQLDSRSIEFVKNLAIKNPRGRARICAHKSPEDSLHEMIIAIRSDSYIRPHRHKNKVESFHLIEGEADVVILSDEGEIEKIIRLGHENNFFYRLETPRYHTLIIHSDVLVIHEITNGPFDAEASEFASFSPSEQSDGVVQYIETLKEKVSLYQRL